MTIAGTTDLSTTYPWREWPDVRDMVNRMWIPEDTPHHSIVGLTGSGKSYLIANGIMPMVEMDRVLIIDSKGDDPVIRGLGKPVRELPAHPWYQGLATKPKPRSRWYRLVVDDREKAGQLQIYRALRQVYKDGNWILVFDEIWDVDVWFHLRRQLEQMYRKARYKRISIIASTQSPVGITRLFYDQASFAWLGRIRDNQRQKRLLEIGGLSTKELPVIASLQRRDWLLAADNGEVFARTRVKV